MCDALAHLFALEFRCFTKGYDRRHIFRSRAAFPFLVTADILDGETHTAPYVKRANAFWRVQLVRRHRQQIAASLVNIQPETTSRLHGVCVKPEMSLALTALGSPPLANQGAYLMNRLNCADFVVGPHQGHENRVRPDGGVQVFESDDAVVVNGQSRDFPTPFFKGIANASHRWMFNGGGNYVAPLCGRCFAKTANGEVVRFSAAGSEDDLVRFRADQSCYLPSSAIYCRARLLAETVHTGRVAVVFGQRTGHRRCDTRVDGRCGTVIQVNPAVRSH